MRLIDADAFRAKLCEEMTAHYRATEGGDYDDGTGEMLADFVKELDEQPTVNAELVKHGHWEPCESLAYRDRDCIFCSACGLPFAPWAKKKYKYCPDCGAKMEVTEE